MMDDDDYSDEEDNYDDYQDAAAASHRDENLANAAGTGSKKGPGALSAGNSTFQEIRSASSIN